MKTLLHCHCCIQIITHHFLLSKVSPPIHTLLWINADLLYPILCPWKYSISHKLLYCPVRILSCFHGNQHYIASCYIMLVMTDNGEWQTMRYNRQWWITYNGNYKQWGNIYNGINIGRYQNPYNGNDRQWEIKDNWKL